MQPAVFLDRDNTLIANDGDLGDPGAVRVLRGVPSGLRRLRKAGFRLVVVTNQGGVARGKFSETDVDSVHQRIVELVDEAAEYEGLIDRFYYCPYHPEGTVDEYRRDHPWRKPNPGMLLQAARDMEIDLAKSWMIGDADRDIKAGRAAGCRTVLISRTAGDASGAIPGATVGTFSDAVGVVLRHARSQSTAEAATGSKKTRASRRKNRRGARTAEGAGDAPSATQTIEVAPAGKGTDTAPPVVEIEATARSAVRSARPSRDREQDDRTTDDVRRAMLELSDELRNDRLRRAEFTAAKMGAIFFQMLAAILALLGLLRLADVDTFIKWMACAALAQLFTITLLVLDGRR